MPTTTNRGRAYIRRSQTIHGRPSAGAMKRQRRRYEQIGTPEVVPQGDRGQPSAISSALPESPALGARARRGPAVPPAPAGRWRAWRAFRTARSARRRLRPPTQSTRRWLPKYRLPTENSYPIVPSPDRELDITENRRRGIAAMSAIDISDRRRRLSKCQHASALQPTSKNRDSIANMAEFCHLV